MASGDVWHAAASGNLDEILDFIESGGDVDSRDKGGNTPLHWACQSNHFDLVGVLFSRGAKVDAVNAVGSTPLHYAAREGNVDISAGLLSFGANLEARNKDDLTPLLVAAGMGHLDVVKVLVEGGSDLEASDRAMYSPLWRAAFYGKPDVVKLLLGSGANKNAKNKRGKMPGEAFAADVTSDVKSQIRGELGLPPTAAIPQQNQPTADTKDLAVVEGSVLVADTSNLDSRVRELQDRLGALESCIAEAKEAAAAAAVAKNGAAPRPDPIMEELAALRDSGMKREVEISKKLAELDAILAARGQATARGCSCAVS
jgi:hypothetical protein